MPSPTHMTIEKWFFLLLTAIVLYLFWTVLEPFALVLLTAAIAAIILSPVDRLLGKFIKYQHLRAAIIVIGMLLLIVVPLFFILLLMARQASELLQVTLGEGGWVSSFDLTSHNLFGILPSFAQEQILSWDLNMLAYTAAEWSFENIGNLFSSTTRLLINTFVFFIALYYLIVDRKKLYKEILAISPLRDSLDSQILKRIIKTVRSVVFGVLILATIQGIFAGIGMTIFNVPGAIIWGALTIVAAQVPFIGSAIVLVPAIIYLFVTGAVSSSIGLLIWSVVIVGLSDNLIGPYLIKGTTHMHALLVLISVLGGLQALGPIGIIIGPTILAAFLVIIELYKSGILTGKK